MPPVSAASDAPPGKTRARLITHEFVLGFVSVFLLAVILFGVAVTLLR